MSFRPAGEHTQRCRSDSIFGAVLRSPSPTSDLDAGLVAAEMAPSAWCSYSEDDQLGHWPGGLGRVGLPVTVGRWPTGPAGRVFVFCWEEGW